MNSRKVAPYGSWRSPITSDVIVAESIGIGEIRLDGDDIYWDRDAAFRGRQERRGTARA